MNLYLVFSITCICLYTNRFGLTNGSNIYSSSTHIPLHDWLLQFLNKFDTLESASLSSSIFAEITCVSWTCFFLMSTACSSAVKIKIIILVTILCAFKIAFEVYIFSRTILFGIVFVIICFNLSTISQVHIEAMQLSLSRIIFRDCHVCMIVENLEVISPVKGWSPSKFHNCFILHIILQINIKAAYTLCSLLRITCSWHCHTSMTSKLLRTKKWVLAT